MQPADLEFRVVFLLHFKLGSLLLKERLVVLAHSLHDCARLIESFAEFDDSFARCLLKHPAVHFEKVPNARNRPETRVDCTVRIELSVLYAVTEG